MVLLALSSQASRDQSPIWFRRPDEMKRRQALFIRYHCGAAAKAVAEILVESQTMARGINLVSWSNR
jgi:hypothetical protein